MKLLAKIKAWFGYTAEEKAARAEHKQRPTVIELRDRLVPDIYYWHNRRGDTSLRCLCGFGGGWPGPTYDKTVDYFVKQHVCYDPRVGGVHREELLPSRNHAVQLIERNRLAELRAEYSAKGWQE